MSLLEDELSEHAKTKREAEHRALWCQMKPQRPRSKAADDPRGSVPRFASPESPVTYLASPFILPDLSPSKEGLLLMGENKTVLAVLVPNRCLEARYSVRNLVAFAPAPCSSSSWIAPRNRTYQRTDLSLKNPRGLTLVPRAQSGSCPGTQVFSCPGTARRKFIAWTSCWVQGFHLKQSSWYPVHCKKLFW